VAKAPKYSLSDKRFQAGETPDVMLALARLLARQAAREAFRTARTEATASDQISPSPTTITDEE
jgi:hypothetical protein